MSSNAGIALLIVLGALVLTRKGAAQVPVFKPKPSPGEIAAAPTLDIKWR